MAAWFVGTFSVNKRSIWLFDGHCWLPVVSLCCWKYGVLLSWLLTRARLFPFWLLALQLLLALDRSLRKMLFNLLFLTYIACMLSQTALTGTRWWLCSLNWKFSSMLGSTSTSSTPWEQWQRTYALVSPFLHDWSLQLVSGAIRQIYSY